MLGSQAADGTDDIIGGSGVDTIQIGAGASFVFSTADSKLQAVENVQLGFGAAVTLTGQTEGFNVIGGGGAETIISGSGDDVINGGLGNDFIQAAAGADVINGGAGSDTVSYADVTGLTSHGEADVEGIAVNFSGESISDDDIADNVGATSATAGDAVGNFDPRNALASGTVQYLVAAANKGTTADDGYAIDTITSIEGFVGSALNDYIVLGADAVTVDAGAGDDLIFSGTAADNINAGSGDDFILIGSSSDHSAAETITGGAGDDTIVFTSFLGETLVLSANVTGVETVSIELTGAAVTAGVSATTNESIDASALTYGITIEGNGGNNTLTGTAFADAFDGGAGTNTYVVTNGDFVIGGAGADTIVVNENVTFGILRADGVTEQLDAVETARLASGVELTIDISDAGTANGVTTVTGVNDGAIEKLIVTGNVLGAVVTVDFSDGGADELALTNVVLDYRGGAGADDVVGTAAADIISGGFGADAIDGGGGSDTLTGGDGADTFTVEGNDSETDIVVITDFEVIAAGPADVDILDVIESDGALATTNPASEVVAATRQDVGGGAITRSDGLTIESFEIDANGLVTLYDSNTALGTTTEVFAETTADIIALVEALHLNIGTANVIQFGLDADGNGTAESTIIAATDLTETNIVNLVGVAFGADLGIAGGAAGEILLA